MKAKYTEESGAEFDDASDIAIRMRVLAGEIYNMQTSAEFLKRQLFASTASGEFLDKLAEQRGLSRRAAEKARGVLTFRVNEVRTMAVPIPRGTVVSTDTERPVRVCTSVDSELPAMTYSVQVPAEAETAGYRGNIASGCAQIPVSVPAEIDSVRNVNSFTGGKNIESDDDLRLRIQNSYFNQPNGMNAAYYISLATSIEGVAKAGVQSQSHGTGSLSVFVRGTDGAVSAEKLAEVQSALDAGRGVNTRVYAEHATAQMYDMDVTVVARPGYSTQEVEELCTEAFEAYIESLPIGGKLYVSALGKRLFDTGCIENCSFDSSMTDVTLTASKYFTPGDVYIEVNR